MQTLGRGPKETITFSTEAKQEDLRALRPEFLKILKGMLPSAVSSLRKAARISLYNNPPRQRASHYLPAANSVNQPSPRSTQEERHEPSPDAVCTGSYGLVSTPRPQQLQSYEVPHTSKHRFWFQPLANIVGTLSTSCWSAAQLVLCCPQEHLKDHHYHLCLLINCDASQEAGEWDGTKLSPATVTASSQEVTEKKLVSLAMGGRGSYD